MLSDLLSVVYAAPVIPPNFVPLQPRSVKRLKQKIEISFHTPGKGLAFDRGLVPESKKFGFGYSDSINSTKIESVEINGDKVIINLEPLPTGSDPRITYALQEESNAQGWTNRRGNLMSPTSLPSFYSKLGYNVPKMINHYAVRFELPLD